MNYPTAIVAAGGLALALVAVPVQFESGDLLPSKSIALADKGGNPNGGNSGDHSNAGGGGGNGPSTGGGWAFGAGGHTSHNANHNPNIASKLKGLNAAHANQNALDNAALGSRVGLIATYKTAAEATLTQQAVVDALIAAGASAAEIAAAQLTLAILAAAEAAALDAAANKNPDNKNVDTTDFDVIAAIRSLLGL